jgi:hypothetical protein
MVGMQDVYLSAEQALELRLIDSILEVGTPWPDKAGTAAVTDKAVTENAQAASPESPPGAHPSQRG